MFKWLKCLFYYESLDRFQTYDNFNKKSIKGEIICLCNKGSYEIMARVGNVSYGLLPHLSWTNDIEAKKYYSYHSKKLIKKAKGLFRV